MSNASESESESESEDEGETRGWLERVAKGLVGSTRNSLGAEMARSASEGRRDDGSNERRLLEEEKK